jgi:hypothetical protein
MPLVLHRTYAQHNESSGNTLRDGFWLASLPVLPLRKNNESSGNTLRDGFANMNYRYARIRFSVIFCVSAITVDFK